MKRMFVVIILGFLISGCGSQRNVVKKNGYYSNGIPFAYCSNRQLFDERFISFVNKEYFSGSTVKVESVANTNGDGIGSKDVAVPLRCTGEFTMNDKSIYDFKITISMTAVDSPHIDALSFKANKTKTLKVANEQHDEFMRAMNSDLINYCTDLMSNVRNTYGRAPLCVPVLSHGQNDTEISGIIGLSDELTGKNIYYFITITRGQFKGDYYYNPAQVDTLISLMKFQHKGV